MKRKYRKVRCHLCQNYFQISLSALSEIVKPLCFSCWEKAKKLEIEINEMTSRWGAYKFSEKIINVFNLRGDVWDQRSSSGKIGHKLYSLKRALSGYKS